MTTTVTPNAPTEVTQSLTPATPLLTPPSPVTLNQVVANSIDGFVLATLSETQNGGRSFARSFDDSSSNPTTLRAFASQHYYTNGDRYVPSASFLMPAPNGRSYMVGEKTTYGNPTVTVQFMGLGNGNPNAMKDWQVVALNNTNTAKEDGFVVAWINTAENNAARGLITGSQTLSLGTTTVAGSSQHMWAQGDVYVPCNSFTMPVCKGTQYQINTLATWGTPSFGAAFVPLDASVMQLGGFKGRTAGRIYQAETDGFLVAYLSANDSDRGYVDLYSNSNQNQLTSSVPLASTSIHLYARGDIYVPLNSATIPVQSGNYYTANFTPTWGEPGLTLWWVPITKAPVPTT